MGSRPQPSCSTSSSTSLGRFFFNRPLPGTLDLTQFAWMPSAVSLGLGYALLRGEHIRVNLLTAPTGPRTQRIIEIVSMVFTLGTVAMMIWFGSREGTGCDGRSARKRSVRRGLRSGRSAG